MTADHHDAELCKRLVRFFPREFLADKNFSAKFDPCCNPTHCYWLEQKVGELGHSISTYSDSEEYSVTIWVHNRAVEEIGANRLHATALAVDAAIGEPT